jgi:malonyl-ACP decarboxylase
MNVPTKPPVQITGLGVVTPVAVGCGDLVSSLKQGKTAFQKLTEPVRHVAAPLPQIDFVSHLLRQAIPPPSSTKKLTARTPTSVCATMAAVWEAWTNAGLHTRSISPERVGILVAGTNLFQQYQHTERNKHAKSPDFVSPRYALQYQDCHLLGILSEWLDLRGPGFVCGGASASGGVGLV